MSSNFLRSTNDPSSIITAIDSATRFPESLDVLLTRYRDDVEIFCRLIAEASSSEDLLARIRSKEFTGKKRGALLKMFRRSVSPVIDTEMAKKVAKVSTESLVRNYGKTFKSIDLLKEVVDRAAGY